MIIIKRAHGSSLEGVVQVRIRIIIIIIIKGNFIEPIYPTRWEAHGTFE